MTASKLGKLVGISESTVVRFASELGYDGYPSMQRALQEMIRSRLTSTQRIKAAGELFDQQDVLGAVLHSDMEKLREVAVGADREDFNDVVDRIQNARHIYILGVRLVHLCGRLSEFLAASAHFENVTLVQSSAAGEFLSAFPDRPGGCEDCHQLSPLFQSDHEHREVCPGPGGIHHCRDR